MLLSNTSTKAFQKHLVKSLRDVGERKRSMALA
jgi:hypothetical protein